MSDDEAAASIHACCANWKKTVAPRARRVVMAAGVVWRLRPCQRRMTNGGVETLYYCADWRAEAMIDLVDDGDV